MVTSIVQYIENAAEKYGDKIVYEDEKKAISFSELKLLAMNIGSCILQYTSPGTPVVIFMERAAENIIAFMGTVYAGCFYVPIDDQMPQERINLILEKLSPSVLIYDTITEKRVDRLNGKIKLLKYQSACKFNCNMEKLQQVQICSTDLLYVLFTSGSTGIPKGVAISHGAVIDFVEWVCQEYGLDKKVRLCNQAPFYFDASIPDIYIPLRTGCTTFVPPRSYYAFPKNILEYLKKKEVNTLIWVPSALCNVANSRLLESNIPENLKLIMFCGEVMPCKHINIWKSCLPNVRYVNLYGPTEATYACMHYEINREFRDDENLPLGKPCGNTRILLLNENKSVVNENEYGEICILGQGLSEGYYNDWDKSKEVFVQNPLNKNYFEKMYRTGDLAYIKNGEMMYAGRMDFQIKRMGYRIELGEIESAINSIAEVDCAACIYEKETDTLFGFYVGNIDVNEVRWGIKEKLPKYMIPNKIIHLEKMKINLNGKIDREFLRMNYTNSIRM